MSKRNDKKKRRIDQKHESEDRVGQPHFPDAVHHNLKGRVPKDRDAGVGNNIITNPPLVIDFPKPAPQSLNDALRSICQSYPDRVEVAKQAYDSAKEYSRAYGRHWSRKKQLKIAWRMLCDFVIVGYEVFIGNRSSNPMHAYNSRSIYKLKMTAGMMTNKSNPLMKQRIIWHEEKEYDISSHVIYGKDYPDILRLHFAVDNDISKLVIGHYGRHLGTFSNRLS